MYELTEGGRFARFRLIRRIGGGSNGEVWEAEEIHLHRRVAVKVLHPLLGLVSEGAVERFFREARAAARVGGEAVPHVYGSGSSGGLHWIAMELVGSGRNLRDWIAEQRVAVQPEDPRSVAGRFAELARALHRMHEEGILHRDLKPANLLLGAGGRWKVADFGHARVDDEATLSRPREELGTYAYLAPEVVAGGARGASPASDQFSLGATLHEALGLSRAFAAASVEGTRERILRSSPTSLRQLRPDLPRELVLVVAKALEKEPEQRYRSMAEFAADLERFARGEPVIARPPGPLRRLRSWSRREPWRAAALAAGTLALASSFLYWQVALAELDRSVHIAGLATTFVDLLDPEEVSNKQRSSREEILQLIDLTLADFGDRPAAQARILQSAGRALRWAEDHASALPALEQAWRIRRQLEGDRSPAALEAQLEYARCLDQEQRHDEARELLVGVLASLPEDEELLLARTLNRLGRCTWELGEFALSRACFRACQSHLDRGRIRDPGLRALNDLDLASVHFRDARNAHDDGDLHAAAAARELAEAAYDRADRGFLERSGIFHPQRPYTWIGRAQLAAFFGDSPRAREAYDEALALAEQSWGLEHEQSVALRRERAGFMARNPGAADEDG
jgi:serine/threonine protein kinase